jgi:hypothetical protein
MPGSEEQALAHPRPKSASSAQLTPGKTRSNPFPKVKEKEFIPSGQCFDRLLKLEHVPNL